MNLFKLFLNLNVAVFITVLQIEVGAQSLSAIQLNKQGVEFLLKQNPAAAQDKFLRALSVSPLTPELHFNLALSFGMQNMPEKAESSYKSILKMTSGLDPQRDLALAELLFLTNFNLGEINGKAKKIDEALFYYQQALNLKPDSQETKINIELLVQQNGGGQGQSKEDDKDQKGDKDQKQDSKDGKDKKDDQKDDKKDDKEKDSKDKGKDKEDKPKQYEKNKPQPKKFKSEELTQGDVNKILGEIKQQEQKIRQDFNRKEVKEKPRGKDW